MKLRNKKTGEIGWLYCDHISIPKKMTVFSEDKDLSAPHWDYNSLAELNEEWEDYEEPKGYWFIDVGTYEVDWCEENEDMEADKEIGNYFETKEEAEKTVEKLKAWKRLKDKGFEFEWVDKDVGSIKFAFFNREGKITKEMWRDIDLLFGGEE